MKNQFFCKIFFQEPAIDWGHRLLPLPIDQLVGTSVVDLLDDVRTFPLGLEFAFRFVCDNDGTPKHKNQLASVEDPLLDELVVGPRHVLAI
jgi:hypothetical protein